MRGAVVTGFVRVGGGGPAAVEFRVADAIVGRVHVGDRDGDGPAPFTAILDVTGRASVSAYRTPDGAELDNSPFTVAVHPPNRAVPAASARAADVEHVVLRTPVWAAESAFAVLATHAPHGVLKPHVLTYLKQLDGLGVRVVLVVSTDRPFAVPDGAADRAAGIIVRRNSGYDFGAWAQALALFPELYGAATLYLVNDSVLVSADAARLSGVVERVRSSGADLVALTASHEYRWHAQSYFLALKPRLLSAHFLPAFFADVAPDGDKDAVIRACELPFAALVEGHGYRVETLFGGHGAGNPLLLAWRALLADGFPFVKLLLLRGAFPEIDIDRWRETLAAAGFAVAEAEAACAAGMLALPETPDTRLIAHRPRAADAPDAPLRVAFHGSWGRRDARARALIAALRRTGAALALHDARAPYHDVLEFDGAPDVAIVDLAAGSDLTDWQGKARRRIAIIDRMAGYEELRHFDRLWVHDASLGAALAGTIDIAVDILPAPTLPGDRAAAGATLDEIARLMMASLRATYRSPPPPPPFQRLEPSLASGVPAEQADFGAAIEMVLLDEAGAAQDAGPRAPDPAGWLLIAPRGSLLAPTMVRGLAAAIATRPDAAIFYGDDLAVETAEGVDQLRLKPDFDLTLLGAQDYVGAPLLVRGTAFAALGGLRPDRRTAASADLLFRAHAAGVPIARIPEVLLAHPHRRVAATDEDYAAMLRSQPLLSAFAIGAGGAPGSFALSRRFDDAHPDVTLVIPTCRARPDSGGDSYVERLLDRIASTQWPMERLAVIVGDDIAGDAAWAGAAWPFALRRIETARAAGERFNYAAKMNRLWRLATSEQIVFLNDDVAPTGEGWLAALQTFALEPDVGGVGARLLFDDGRLQHAGMAPQGDGASHLWFGRRRRAGTYQEWASVQREWSMVTGAVFATRRAVLEEVNGFDERFSLEFNDTDLCLRLRALGYRIVCTPDAEFTHAERASRGDTPPPGNEVARFHARWRRWLADDPSWHPGLRRDRLDMMPCVPGAGEWFA